ncbi:YfhO family protein [Paludisphaera sp.]|uniref:YfhO family protein n=1 Tax=Paludisphaera sp. TaxID=2017432 RepID=UPI00301CEC15
MPHPEETADEARSSWFQPPGWGVGDLVALAAWTVAVCWVFREAVFLRGAFFYFDITEINYPYRHFFAEELKAGRFSRWCPLLYNGMPLFSESQAGYLHPLKYLLYPWMETWKAINLDTVLSIWLAGAGTHGWLRRHVGPVGALAGGVVFGFGGFTWAHLYHTSMINALASVPFVVWALEWSWGAGRWRGAALGGFALAWAVFAGHLQDFILTSGIVGIVALHRACTSATRAEARSVLTRTFGLLALGVLISAVQWMPSKELLDRSPRAGGLSYEELVYGSWSPELLPTLVMREAYGTRARDTDWMDGYYPYHETNAYLGLLALGLAIVGASGPGARDRWTTGLVILTITGALLMLGRFTFLFDYANRIPVAGSSREPARLHLLVSLGVAGLAAVGAERLRRPGAVSLKGATGLVLALVVVSLPILAYAYHPIWTDARPTTNAYLQDRSRWLTREVATAVIRNASLVVGGLAIARAAASSASARRRAALASILPVLVIVDLLSAHAVDVVTVPPSYWTEPPESARRLKADPTFVRVFGMGDRGSGEPGYASEPIDFMPARDALDWSLPAAWGLAGSKGITPMISQRSLDYTDHAKYRAGRFDIDSVSHILAGRAGRDTFTPNERVGEAFLHANPDARPRARLEGRPLYADDRAEAIAAIDRLGPDLKNRLIVEDPGRPLGPDAEAAGSATIVVDAPEEVVVAVNAEVPAYLVLADTFDPGWTATVDGEPATIHPAYVAFRAVLVGPGEHRVVFRYSPAGFLPGLAITALGGAIALVSLIRPGPRVPSDDHATTPRAGALRRAWIGGAVLIVLASIPAVGPSRLGIQARWRTAFHAFTWGPPGEAIRENRR